MLTVTDGKRGCRKSNPTNLKGKYIQSFLSSSSFSPTQTNLFTWSVKVEERQKGGRRKHIIFVHLWYILVSKARHDCSLQAMYFSGEGRSGMKGGGLMNKAGRKGIWAGRGKVWLRETAVPICFFQKGKKKKNTQLRGYKIVTVHQWFPTRCYPETTAQVPCAEFHFNKAMAAHASRLRLFCQILLSHG